MKDLDYNGLVLCRLQGNLFEHFSDYLHCSPYVFIRRFMYSDLAARFDNKTVLLESSTEESMLFEITTQYGFINRGNPKEVHPEILYWVGYVYRFWSYYYDVPSYLLFRHVQPKMLINRYYVYHSMDIRLAIEKIIDEENILLPPNKTIQELIEDMLKEDK